MPAILLGLGSSLSWGVADFCGGLASRRSRVAAVVLLSQATGLAILVVALVLHGTGPPPAGDLALGAAAGASGAAGLAAFYRALAVGTMSLVAPVAALGVVIPVAAGVASGDRPAAVAAAGAVLAVGGAVLAGRARGPASTRGLGALGTQRGLLSVVAVLGSLYPVATVMLARAVLGERLGAGQTAGVAAALAGVALIALGAG